MQLTITNNSASNPLTLDLSQYIRVEDGAGMDVANPAFTQRVYTRSLLKEGASLALTQFTEKELQFPLLLGPVGGLTGAPQTMGAVATLIAQVNQVLETPGATCTWKPDGVSQATTFDIIVGQFEVAYSFRKEEAHWTEGNLRIFTQPFGRTASPRLYATASGVGPVLMISPYASSGVQAIGASTQAGVPGYGGQQQGASSGIFYWGSPSLAGDAPAQLEISYVGPLPNTATNTGVIPWVAVSLLPDANYQPLITAPKLGTPTLKAADAVASQYLSQGASTGGFGLSGAFVSPFTTPGYTAPPVAWAGQHRVFAIARASVSAGYIQSGGPLVKSPTSATVYPGDWSIYDLGNFTVRASEPPQSLLKFSWGHQALPPSTSSLDITALVTLPDASTWFLNAVTGASTIFDPTRTNPISNTLLIDDILGDQFVSEQPSQTSPPTPATIVSQGQVVSPASRGLVPRLDPKNGLPPIAILGIGQNSTASSLQVVGGSWANPQNVRTLARVSVLERARYVLP